MTKYEASYKNLSVILATAYSLYLNTQNFHWNITGSNFYSLHKLSEKLYEGLAEDIDQIAERIRVIGYVTPASFIEFQKLTKIKDSLRLSNNSNEVISELLNDWKLFIKTILEAIEAAHEGDEGTLGFLTDLLQLHEKNQWLIDSHLA